MNPQTQYSLTPIINARGVFTPLGVSRSSDHVAQATAKALKYYFDMEELQAVAGKIIADHCGSEFATITNCASAGISLSIAATMCGSDPEKIAQLPNARGLNNKVIIATCHNVNYGHPIEQDIRITGCDPIFVGTEQGCTLDEIGFALAQSGVTALLYVESRLTWGQIPDLKAIISLAHKNNIPVIVDGAAQDMRIVELVASGADLLIFSSQKYLAGPTAGIVVGKHKLVEAIAAQIHGIGRPMKAGKEAIIGALAAIEERQQRDDKIWSATKREEAAEFAAQLAKLANIKTGLVKDPSKGDFWRIDMIINEDRANTTAIEMAQKLGNHTPSIHCNSQQASEGILNFEVLDLDENERGVVIEHITFLLRQASNTRP